MATRASRRAAGAVGRKAVRRDFAACLGLGLQNSVHTQKIQAKCLNNFFIRNSNHLFIQIQIP